MKEVQKFYFEKEKVEHVFLKRAAKVEVIRQRKKIDEAKL
jgi:hypothetical protein